MRIRICLGVMAVFASLALPATAGAALRPSVSLTATPSSLPASGGKITLRVTVHNATSCTFAASPPVAGFAGVVKCSNGAVTRSGKLGKGLSANRVVLLSVMVKSAKASVLAKTTVTQLGTKKATAPIKAKPPTAVGPTATTTPTPTTTVTTTTVPKAPTTTVPAVAASTTTLDPFFLYTGPGSGSLSTTANVVANGQTLKPSAGQVSFNLIDQISGKTIGTYVTTAANPGVCTFDVSIGALLYTVTPAAPSPCTGAPSQISVVDVNLYGFYAQAVFAGATGYGGSTSASSRV